MPEFVEAPVVDARTNVLSVRGVTARAGNGTRLLHDVSFDAARGEMLAIVGPTGAGKTSLARAVAGMLAVEHGDVFVDGRVAYVPQQDALHAALGLRTALLYAAALRMPAASRNERVARVEAVLEELGLTAHGATKIGDLSGGQRKRASVAAQLLGDPDVLVLDEPTAGLDPGYEKVVLDTLRELAANGRTVITVTHSVEVLHACDRVVFLAAGGVAFFGTPKQATRHFAKRALADVFLALDTAPELWLQKFAGHTQPNPPAEQALAGHEARTGSLTGAKKTRQLGMLLRRQLDLLLADRRHLLLLALQAPIVGGLLWAVMPGNGLMPDREGAYGSKAGVVLLFIVLSATWLGVANAIREIVRERDIARWEAASGLSPRAYVISKFVPLAAIAVVQSAIVAFLATGRQHATHRADLVFLAALAGVAATVLGLVLSSVARTTDRAGALLPVSLVAQLVLAGEWAASAKVPLLHELRWLVSSRWTLEAMAASLNGPAAQRTRSIVALLVLVAVGLDVAIAAVGRAVRPAKERAARTPRRVALGGLTAPATVLAAALSLSAGGAGVLVLAGHVGHASPSSAPQTIAAAPSLDAHTKTTTPPAPATTAPVAVTTPPVSTPPVTAAPVTHHTPLTLPIVNVPVTVPQVSVPEVPVTLPPVTTPTPAPKTTPTTSSPFSNWYKMFNPFAPKVNN